ncbi:MAG: MmgE/PrpD family protein, partial [Promethearchaeota archaeon]
IGPLRTYRHAPNTGSRKSWAAGDATSRGVFLAFQSLRGEMGYPTALTAPKWGFYDRIWEGKCFEFQQSYGTYVMENILFKISYPAEFHGQTAVEAAIKLHSKVINQLDEIKRIEIFTHEAAVRIIDKKGPLLNPAARDHCLQYMVAIGLLFGKLEYEDYEDERASDPRIEVLRKKMVVQESPSYTQEYHERNKRAIANSIQIFFNDGTNTEIFEVKYPLGHRKRRSEAIKQLEEKFRNNLLSQFSIERVNQIMGLFTNQEKLDQTPVPFFMELLRK